MRRRAFRFPGLGDVAPWLPVAMNLWEMSIAAPQVIALRSARMLDAGPFPSARDQREFARMFQEKAEAYAESMTAMSLELFAMNPVFSAWAAPFAAWGPRAPRRRKGLHRLVATGVAPIHRRVKANAARLRRGRR
jgi:hypothetical protein